MSADGRRKCIYFRHLKKVVYSTYGEQVPEQVGVQVQLHPNKLLRTFVVQAPISNSKEPVEFDWFELGLHDDNSDINQDNDLLVKIGPIGTRIIESLRIYARKVIVMEKSITIILSEGADYWDGERIQDAEWTYTKKEHVKYVLRGL